MTVSELIEVLSVLDQSLPVYLVDRVNDDEPMDTLAIEDSCKTDWASRPRRVVLK